MSPPTLHLMYGFTGAGKTIFAKQLERELPAVRFSPDEWMVTLYGTNPPAEDFQDFRARTIQLIWGMAVRLLQLGLDVILDFGFWDRASRDDARTRAQAVGASYRLYFLDSSEEVMRRRVLERTARMPAGELVIDETAFELFKSRFEPLGRDEEHIRIQTDDWDKHGQYEGELSGREGQILGEWSIRRELVTEAPVDVVWSFVGTPALLSRWWCPPPTVNVLFEQREGGHYEEHYRDAERTYDLEGTVVAYMPPRRLAIRRVTQGAPSPADLIDITLHDEGGRTRVVIDHSFERLPENRRKEMESVYAEAWSSSLGRLRDMVTTIKGEAE